MERLTRVTSFVGILALAGSLLVVPGCRTDSQREEPQPHGTPGTGAIADAGSAREAELERELTDTKTALASARADLSRALRIIESLKAELDAARQGAVPPVTPPAAEARVTPVTEDVQEGTVYVTRTGKKYHRSGCQYLRQSMIPMALKDARRVYGPCSVCVPPP